MDCKLISALALSGIALLVACKKDNSLPHHGPHPDYAILKPGSYWIYANYFVDALGNEIDLGNIDSIYIARDTLFNGKLYYKKVVASAIFPSISFWRDSLGILVGSNGARIPLNSGVLGTDVSINNTDTLYTVTHTLLPGETSVTAPAGTFKVHTITHVYKIYDKDSSGTITYRYRDCYSKYHLTLGDIERTYFKYNEPVSQHYVQRLIRYKVK